MLLKVGHFAFRFFSPQNTIFLLMLWRHTDDWRCTVQNILHLFVIIFLFLYYRQPEGCLQYHTTLSGRFQSFNFADSSTPAHLANQKYVCINKIDFFAYLQGYPNLSKDCLMTATVPKFWLICLFYCFLKTDSCK